MNNWAIGEGYMGLYANVNKREAAKEELNTLQMFGEQMRLDRSDKEAAQLKEEAYKAEVSKFSDQLLAPDRKRINEKSKILSERVREHIKTYGGDMEKFFANGGHKIMSTYKDELINSNESNQYLNNKKNMDRIVDLQGKGMGHLINPTDKQNLDNYYKAGEGNITYTGMMNEIEMPDAANYSDASYIPAKDILYHNGNYAKVYGNWMTTYPDRGTPEEHDLEIFVSKNYNVKGSNWQKDAKYQEMALNQAYRMASLNNARYIAETKAGKGSGSGSGVSPGDSRYKALQTSNYAKLYSEIATKPLNTSNFNSSIYNLAGKGLYDSTIKKTYNSSAGDYVDGGDGGVGLVNYQVRNSKELHYNNIAVAKHLTGDTFKIENGTIKDLPIMNKMHDAAGVRVADWKKNDVSKDSRNFRIGEVITVGIVKTAEGNGGEGTESIVMNIVDGEGSETINKTKTDNYNKLMGDSTIKLKAALVLESGDLDNPIRYYIPFDPTVTTTQSGINAFDKSNDITDENRSSAIMNEQYKIQQANIDKKTRITEDFYNKSVVGDTDTALLMNKEIQTYSHFKSPDYRNILIQSYYLANAQIAGNKDIYSSGVKNHNFSKIVNESMAEGYTNINEDLANPQKTDSVIMSLIMEKNKSKDQNGFFNYWNESYRYLRDKKQ